MAPRLTLGPVLYNWPAERWRDFYFEVADEMPVATVYLGEVICSKRAPLFDPHLEEASRGAGHGGMDFIMDWRLIDCLRNGLPLDQDVYDAALWSVIGPLSEWSVANRSNSIDVPDFTNGSWETNKPVDITLSKGATTTVRETVKAESQLNI